MEAGKWAPAWEGAKKAFEAATNKKKPKATVGAKVSKKSGLSALLSECDKEYNEGAKLSASGKKDKALICLKKFDEASASFEKLGNAYTLDIQKAMTEAKDMSIMNELDVLRKQIQAISSS